jgi:carboxyl-terminal processing protease
MTKANVSKSAVLFWMASFGLLLAAGAWQAHLQARSVPPSPLVVSGQKNVEGEVLDCAQVRSRVGQFLDLHYKYRSFDEVLSERTFDRLFETLDPARLYFVTEDLSAFASLRKSIPERLSRLDCSFIEEVHGRYRALAAQRLSKNLEVLGAPMDLDSDDEMYVGKPRWSASRDELEKHWHKRLKFQVINFLETETEAKARERLSKRFRQQLDQLNKEGTDEAFNAFLNAFASALDPHSSHFLPEEQEDFNIRLGNRLEGIGATLKEEDGYISITALVPGGAAARDGRLKVGDKIIGVDPGGESPGMTDIIDMPLSKAVRLIRGPKGTRVKLVVLRQTEQGTERLSFELERDAVLLTESRAKGGVLKIGERKVGVVRLPSFYTDFACRKRSVTECQGAAADVLKEIRALQSQGIEGVVLDLRSNGGGDLQESILLSGLFFPEGPVVQTVDRRRISRALADEDGQTYYNGPLVVFTSKYSASASEIVAGALQDYGRAVVVGDDHTFGKATVQVVEEVPGTKGRASDGAIKVTQSKFYRPSGLSTQVAGVVSDVVLPSVLSATEVGERQQPYALEQDRVKPASKFAAGGLVEAMREQLRLRSGERVASSQKFKELNERILKLREQDKRQTLSLKTRREESKKEKGNGEGSSPGGVDPAEDDAGQSEDGLVGAFSPKDFALEEAGRILLDIVELRPKETASGGGTRP